MTIDIEVEGECRECGNGGATECPDCIDGTEYCGQCLGDHRAQVHDEDSE